MAAEGSHDEAETPDSYDGDEHPSMETDDDAAHQSLVYIPLGGVVNAAMSADMEDWTTPRSNYSQQVESADDAFGCSRDGPPSTPSHTPRSPMTSPAYAEPLPRQRLNTWPLPPPEQERLLDSDPEPSDAACCGAEPHTVLDRSRASDASDVDELVPQSPSHVWLAEPTSIDEPLLLLDEEAEEYDKSHRLLDEEAEGQDIVSQLRQELYEARATSKAHRVALEEQAASSDAADRERSALQVECGLLRSQMQATTTTMAAEWGQTLGFQERLREEEAHVEKLACELQTLQETIAERAEEEASLQQDAGLWRLLCRTDTLQSVSTDDLDTVLEAALPGTTRLHAEMHSRSRGTALQLAQELENRLCVVCRDAEKAILFKPCLHVCVCEGCRGRLRPYRCPICKESIREHIGKVHF